MDNQTHDDGCIRGLLNACNCQIEELEACPRQASPQMREICEHVSRLLIANQETVKCGLMVTDEDESYSLC
jgi:hypothetical protein